MIKLVLLSLIIGLIALANVNTNALGSNSLYIYGGAEIKPHSLPYQVYIQIWYGTIFMECGGSIISRNFILTAAHCIADQIGGILLAKITITLGAHNIINEREKEQVTQKIPKQNVIKHPQVDAALLRTLESVTYTLEIQPIKLPQLKDKNEDYAGYDATASGWGLNYGGESHKLRSFTLKVLPSNKCIYDNVKPATMCVEGSLEHSTCQGDSGGPLVIRNSKKEFLQIGITTLVVGKTDKPCAEGYPTGYTRLTEIIDWIKKNSDAQIS